MQEFILRPPHDSWTVAIHRTPTDATPLGTGVVIDTHRILTCAHILRTGEEWIDEIWVAFPKAGVGRGDRRRVVQRLADHFVGDGIDLAVVELDRPVPPTATPARLRAIAPNDLQGMAWWAFGFPQSKPHGSDAHGTIGAVLGYGNLRLDTGSPYGIEQGFSGGALWSPDYYAVIGLVAIAYQGPNHGSGEALALEYVDRLLPEIKLFAATAWTVDAVDETALAAWGWELRTDPEAGRHWLPRSRGVAVDTERGYRFRGRTAALADIMRWLDDPAAQSRVLVVTGSPGVGKSAVLGRIVTTADRDIRRLLPRDDDGVRATEGSVACAVHTKGKSALDVAVEIARAAAVRLPDTPEDLLPALRERLTRLPQRFSLIIDALDEAADPADARDLLRTVVVPLARAGTEFDIRVVVGTRRSDDFGDLLGEFGPDAEIIDLDSASYFAESDLTAYAAATLQLVGAERIGNPYAEAATAHPVARRIAALAGRNFLVAGLVARTHGLRDAEAIRPAEVSFTPTVADALDSYLAALPPAGGASARLALSVLAYAEAPGLPLPLWRIGVEALNGLVSEDQLAAFARSSAANFIVESSADREDAGYRLFHQALNDALLDSRADRAADEQRLVEAWRGHGRAAGWESVPGYLLRSLPTHARRAGLVDWLLTDDAYLLHSNLRRLLAVADDARTEAGRARARLLQMSPGAVDAVPAERAAMFSVVQTLDNIGGQLAVRVRAPYRCCWARTAPRLERTVLEGHTDYVFVVCAVMIGGRQILASGGADGRILLWDPTTGQCERIIDAHDSYVRALCEVRIGRRVLLSSAGEDGSMKLWDPGTGALERVVHEGRDWVRAMCALPTGGENDLLASANDDSTVRLWDPATGQLEAVLDGHTAWPTALCTIPAEGRHLLVSAGNDGIVRLWDPAASHDRYSVYALGGHMDAVSAVSTVPMQDRTLLAFAGSDGIVRLWNPLTRSNAAIVNMPGHDGAVTGLCAIPIGDTTLLASASEDLTIRLWNPTSETVEAVYKGHTDRVRAVCCVMVGERSMLASGSDDGTVRLWDPTMARARDEDGAGSVPRLCAVPTAHGTRVALTGDDRTVRIWHPETGEPVGVYKGNVEVAVTAVGAVTVHERTHVVIAGGDGTIRLWNPDTGEHSPVSHRHQAPITAVCTLTVGEREIVASADEEGTVQLWDPAGAATPWMPSTGEWITAVCALIDADSALLASAGYDGTILVWRPGRRRKVARLAGHRGAVNAMCTVASAQRQLLASASDDATVRLWDPAAGAEVLALRGHNGSVNDICVVPGADRSLLASVSDDRTARLWDVNTGTVVRSIPVHHVPLACRYVAGTFVIGLDAGIMAIVLDD